MALANGFLPDVPVSMPAFCGICLYSGDSGRRIGLLQHLHGSDKREGALAGKRFPDADISGAGAAGSSPPAGGVLPPPVNTLSPNGVTLLAARGRQRQIPFQ